MTNPEYSEQSWYATKAGDIQVVLTQPPPRSGEPWDPFAHVPDDGRQVCLYLDQSSWVTEYTEPMSSRSDT